MRLLSIFTLTALLALAAALCWPGDYMMSKDIGCAKASNARGKEICAALSESMEWTWMGHAIVSPGWRVTWEGLRETYCKAHVTAADIPALKELAKATDWRLESGAGNLITLIENASGKGAEPENSVFHPKNEQYVLKGGCGE
ncbi:MAG: hypothetical protein EPN97_00840 [Alphaproteobacteria bacterium]|nr:MAG: hypothetical protein EPN97_00840 [Alphaproteobacteria bacterium]